MDNDLLRLNLQYFAEDGEPVESAEPSEPTTQDEPTKTFTQEQMDKTIAERLARERKKYEKYVDYDELKAKLVEFESAEQTRKEAEMTELEKLQAKLAEKETQEQTLAQQLADMQKAVESEKIRNEFIKVATSESIAYIDDALALADLSQITIEDGKVVGMTDIIKSLVENKPFLVAKKQPKPIGEPTNGGSTNEEVKTLEAQLADAKKAKDFSKVIELSNKIAGFIKK